MSRDPTHFNRAFLLCPYCHHAQNVWDHFLEDGKETALFCERCEREFDVIAHCTWTYSTWTKKEDE